MVSVFQNSVMHSSLITPLQPRSAIYARFIVTAQLTKITYREYP